MEEGASPPRWALDKKLGRMLQWRKRKRERKREGGARNWRKKKGEKLNFELCLTRLSFIKVTTSVTHASIYRLGSFLEKLSWENFLEKLLWENFLEKLELSYTPPIIAKLTPMTKKTWKYKKKSLLQRLLKMPRNTRLKPYTTRMVKIQGLDEGKTYSNIYKDKRAHT